MVIYTIFRDIILIIQYKIVATLYPEFKHSGYRELVVQPTIFIL